MGRAPGGVLRGRAQEWGGAPTQWWPCPGHEAAQPLHGCVCQCPHGWEPLLPSFFLLTSGLLLGSCTVPDSAQRCLPVPSWLSQALGSSLPVGLSLPLPSWGAFGVAGRSRCPRRVQLSRVLHHSGVGTALPALPMARRTAVLDAVDSLAGRLGASSPVLTLVLKFRLSLIADPQNFYPAEGAGLPFLEEQAAASWLEASPY